MGGAARTPRAGARRRLTGTREGDTTGSVGAAMDENSGPADELTPREAARLRARDRKRTTRMVVDNAAVKRTALALAQRRERVPPPPPGPAG